MICNIGFVHSDANSRHFLIICHKFFFDSIRAHSPKINSRSINNRPPFYWSSAWRPHRIEAELFEKTRGGVMGAAAGSDTANTSSCSRCSFVKPWLACLISSIISTVLYTRHEDMDGIHPRCGDSPPKRCIHRYTGTSTRHH